MYLLIFGISTGLLFCSEKIQNKFLKKLLIITALLIPSILAGLRDYSIGNDVLLYGNGWFERSCNYSSLFRFIKNASDYSIGIGYATVNWIVSRFTDNPHYFYFFYELLQLSILYFALQPFKESISLPYAFLVYFFCYYNDSLNILRQIMAIILVLFSYKYVVTKKPIKFVFILALAISFHTSGIIGILLYPLSWAVENKYLRQAAKIAIIGASLFFIAGYEYITELIFNSGILSLIKYSHYMSASQVGGRFIRLTYWGILLLCILWMRRKSENGIDNYRTLEIYMVISTIMSFVTFLGSTWIVRATYYFDIFQVILIPYLASQLSIRVKISKKDGGYAILLIIVFIQWLITFVIRNGAATYPYMFMRY